MSSGLIGERVDGIEHVRKSSIAARSVIECSAPAIGMLRIRTARGALFVGRMLLDGGALPR